MPIFHGDLFKLPPGLPKAVVMVLAVVSRKHQQIKAQQTAILNDYQSLQGSPATTFGS